MCEHSRRGFRALKAARISALAILSIVVFAAVADKGWGQDSPQFVRARRGKPAEPIRTEKPANTPSPALDPSSSLGQAMAACENMSNKSQELFTLPGLKGDISLDRCYRGRDYQVCTFNAFVAEGKSLIDSYTKVIDAKYTEITSVDDICKLSRDSLASDGNGAEDFIKRFAILKSQYESHSRCAANVKQAFKDLVLTALSQAPEVLKSMNDAVDGDLGKVSQVEDQLVDLSEKMLAELKAIRTVQKIHQVICTTQAQASKDNTNADASKANTNADASKDKAN